MVDWQPPEALENLVGAFRLVLTQKPEGALVNEEDSDKEDAGWDELECHWDSPTDRQARVDGLRNAVLAE